MTTILRFEVDGEDCLVDLRPDNTIFDLMEIVCCEWLDEARDGDGDVTAHMWKIVSPNNVLHVGPFPLGFSLNDCGDFKDEKTELPNQSTRLSSLDYLKQSGAVLEVEYDFGHTMRFKINLMSIETVTQEEASNCPKLFEEAPTAFLPDYTPPNGTPNLNDIFPHANKLLFDESSAAQWILMFSMDANCAGAVEAGPDAMSDMVFCPLKFGSVHEFLVALDLAGQQHPSSCTRPDAFSRMVFPLEMTRKDEEKYQQYKNELDRFHGVLVEKGCDKGGMLLETMRKAGLSEDDVHRMCGPQESVVRVSKDDMEKSLQVLDLSKAFPMTNVAYDREDDRWTTISTKDYRWMSYRRGKMQLCKGEEKARGIPKAGGVLAESKQTIESLHEFFCVAEALWASIK